MAAAHHSEDCSRGPFIYAMYFFASTLHPIALRDSSHTSENPTSADQYLISTRPQPWRTQAHREEQSALRLRSAACVCEYLFFRRIPARPSVPYRETPLVLIRHL